MLKSNHSVIMVLCQHDPTPIFDLTSDLITIGNTPDYDIFHEVFANHRLVIKFLKDSYYIDTQLSEILINDVVLQQKHKLEHGDKVTIGDTEFICCSTIQEDLIPKSELPLQAVSQSTSEILQLHLETKHQEFHQMSLLDKKFSYFFPKSCNIEDYESIENYIKTTKSCSLRLHEKNKSQRSFFMPSEITLFI